MPGALSNGFKFIAVSALTIAISLATRPRQPEDLRGLVYGLTSKPTDDVRRWYERPGTLALLVLAGAVVLNAIFF